MDRHVSKCMFVFEVCLNAQFVYIYIFFVETYSAHNCLHVYLGRLFLPRSRARLSGAQPYRWTRRHRAHRSKLRLISSWKAGRNAISCPKLRPLLLVPAGNPRELCRANQLSQAPQRNFPTICHSFLEFHDASSCVGLR